MFESSTIFISRNTEQVIKVIKQKRELREEISRLNSIERLSDASGEFEQTT